MRESAIDQKGRRHAESLGMMYVKFESPTGGMPDRIVISGKGVLFLEVKRPGKKPEKRQDYWLRKIDALTKGLPVHARWAASFEDIKFHITELLA